MTTFVCTILVMLIVTFLANIVMLATNRIPTRSKASIGIGAIIGAGMIAWALSLLLSGG